MVHIAKGGITIYKTKHCIEVSDCIELLKKIPNNSIDLVIADPPYNINIAEWDNYDNYIDWAKNWISEVYRVLTPTGNFIVFGGLQFSNSTGGDLLEIVHYIRHNSKFNLVNMIVWYYKNGITAHRFFANRHEEIMWYAKSNKYYFNLDAVRVKYDEKTLNLYKKDKRLSHSKLELGKNPTNVWEISRLNSNSTERVGHKTQKPSAIITRLVASLTPSNGIVLDLFAGSGITAKTCIELGLNSISCDIDNDFLLFFNKQKAKIKSTYSYEIINLNEVLDFGKEENI